MGELTEAGSGHSREYLLIEQMFQDHEVSCQRPSCCSARYQWTEVIAWARDHSAPCGSTASARFRPAWRAGRGVPVGALVRGGGPRRKGPRASRRAGVGRHRKVDTRPAARPRASLCGRRRLCSGCAARPCGRSRGRGCRHAWRQSGVPVCRRRRALAPRCGHDSGVFGLGGRGKRRQLELRMRHRPCLKLRRCRLRLRECVPQSL